MSRARTPVKRLGSAEEVAKLAVYLASDAACFVTGVTWYIDGGAHLWGDNWIIPDARRGFGLCRPRKGAFRHEGDAGAACAVSSRKLPDTTLSSSSVRPCPRRVDGCAIISSGGDVTFGIALVPLCFLSMLLFTRHPTKTNFIFDEQEALLANPYVRSVARRGSRSSTGSTHFIAIFGAFRPIEASARTARFRISSGALSGGSARAIRRRSCITG